jgi:hypothetical protein
MHVNVYDIYTALASLTTKIIYVVHNNVRCVVCQYVNTCRPVYRLQITASTVDTNVKISGNDSSMKAANQQIPIMNKITIDARTS